MGGVQFVDHAGKRICYIDFVNVTAEGAGPIIEQGKKLIASQPLGSVLTLTNITGAKYNQDVVRQLKAFTAHNKPYVKAGAVVGITGITKIILQAVNAFSGRNLAVIDTVEKAKDWLVEQ